MVAARQSATIAAPRNLADPVSLQDLLAFAERHMLLSMGLVALTVALIYTEVARLFRGYTAVRPAGLTALINRDDAVVLDLSAQADFEKGHIAGAKSVPAADFTPEHKRVPNAKTAPVVVTCRTGQASADAATKLKKAGFEKVYWLDGGIAAWQQAELPLVKGRG